jgi:hypothetical protein
MRDDESFYKAVNPPFDFTLNGGEHCFIAEIYVHGGDGGSATVEVYTSNIPE